VNIVKLNLSPKQQKIVEFSEGALLVKAGPGSGKTRVLIERIKKLLVSKKRCKVLALTFSNLAAEEMKARLEEDKNIENLMDNVTVGTIHSFCLEIVQKRGNLIGLGEELVLFEDKTDQQRMLRDIFSRDSELKNILRKNDKPEILLSQYIEMIAEQKKKFVSPEMYDGNENFKKIYVEYSQYLQEQNAIDFDDILFYAYRILSENPSVAKMYASLYKYICVDEAQDLNFAQYEVIKALCADNIKNVMFVGDANQSIYGFNGSNSELMVKNFVNDFKPTIFELNENFRSAKEIIAYANKLVNIDSVSNYYYNGELRAFACSDEKSEAEFVVNKIDELREKGHSDVEGNLGYDDFAIIARNRYVLQNIEIVLQQKNIPYFYKKSASRIESESDYLKIFDLSLRLFVNAKDIIHLNELCKLLKIEVPRENFKKGHDLLNAVLSDEVYQGLRLAFQFMGEDNFNFGKGLKKILEYVDSSDTFDEDEKYLIYSDVLMWEKHWKKYISQVPGENRTIVSFRNYIALGKTQDISGDEGITLLTAHMSKGLQYEVVFVIGLTEGTFPDYRAIKSGGKELEQEKNNMFVAATRAKRLCYFTYPKRKRMPWGDDRFQLKSRYLEGVEVTLI